MKRFYGGQRLELPRRRRSASSISCSIREAVVVAPVEVAAEEPRARAEGVVAVARRLLRDPGAVVKLLRNNP